MAKNYNVEFIDKMIPHHQMALDMVEEYKNKIDNKDLIAIMENIKTSQKKQIDEMNNIKGDEEKSLINLIEKTVFIK